MNTENILNLINALPAYIQYIYPGYITIYLYMFFKEKLIKDNGYTAFKSLALSYFYIEFLKFMRHVVGIRFICDKLIQMHFWNVAQIIGLSGLAIIVAYVTYMFNKSQLASHIFEKLKISAELNKSEIAQLDHFGKGAWVNVYLKDSDIVYEGSLAFYHVEDSVERRNITLAKYRKCKIDDKEKPIHPYIENHDTDVTKQVVLYYDDILKIEKVKEN